MELLGLLGLLELLELLELLGLLGRELPARHLDRLQDAPDA